MKPNIFKLDITKKCRPLDILDNSCSLSLWEKYLMLFVNSTNLLNKIEPAILVMQAQLQMFTPQQSVG